MKIKKEKHSEVIIYTLLLLLTLVVSNIVVLSTFDILTYQVIGSALTYPFVFYFSHKLIKLVDGKSMIDIIIGIVFIQLIIVYLMNGQILAVNAASVIAFVIAQALFYLLIKNLKTKKENVIYKVIFIYFIVLILDAILFNLIASASFDASLLYSVLVKLAVALGISLIEISD